MPVATIPGVGAPCGRRTRCPTTPHRPVPCLSSSDTAAGGSRRLPATPCGVWRQQTLRPAVVVCPPYAAVGHRPDDAPCSAAHRHDAYRGGWHRHTLWPCSVARRHAVWRPQTLRPATVACPPRAALCGVCCPASAYSRRVTATVQYQTLWPAIVVVCPPHLAVFGVSRHCGRRSLSARHTLRCLASHCGRRSSSARHTLRCLASADTAAGGRRLPATPSGVWRQTTTAAGDRRLPAIRPLAAVGRRPAARHMPPRGGWQPSPARHTPPRGGRSSSRRRPRQCCLAPR